MVSDDHQEFARDREGRSIVARFASPARARKAVAALHEAHYARTWLGVTSVAATSSGDETLTVESGGFFSETKSLVDALVSHGIPGDTARDIERSIDPGDALVTLDPKNKDITQAVAILERHGGYIAVNAVDAGEDFWLPPLRPRPVEVGVDPQVDYGLEDTFVQRPSISR